MNYTLLAGVTFLLPPLLFFSALTLAPYFILLALICMLPLFKPSISAPMRILLALLLCWPLVSSLWSIMPSITLLEWGGLLGSCITGLLVCQQSRARPLPRWVWIGMSLSLMLCCLLFAAEIVPTKGLITWASAALDGDPVKFINQTVNRGICAYAVIVWPLCMALWLYGQRLIMVGVLAACILLLACSINLSAQLGFVVGAITFVTIWASPRVMAKIAVFAVPLLFFMGPTVLVLVLESPYFAQHMDQLQRLSSGRVLIWQSLVQHAAPPYSLLGWGMHTSGVLPLSQAMIQEMNMPAIPTHPHNTMLQLRLELGWIGLFLVSAAIGLVLHLIARAKLSHNAKALAMATALSYIATGACSYNVWQSWWVALPWVAWFLWQRMPPHNATKPALSGLKKFLVLFVPFIGLLGLLPHGLFSLDVGNWHYMTTAWDEDSYTLFTLENVLPVYRQLGGTVLAWLQHAWGLDAALILMDTITPMFAAALAAVIAYHAGFRSLSGLFIASCLLLFALAFMALSSSALIGSPIAQLLPFSSMFYPDWIRMFVPNLYENFLNLYKSPEPQISLVVQFAALLLLLRHAQTQHWRYVIGLALVALAFPFIYISTGIALIVCIGCYGAMAWWVRRHPSYLCMVAIASGATALAAYWYLRQPPSSSASVFLFHSHLPIISASVVWAVILAWPIMQTWRRQFIDASQRSSVPITAVFTFACCLVPLITLNQQIITGLMVQSRTWDYYSNMPFVALVLLLEWPTTRERFVKHMPTRLKALRVTPPRAAALLAVWLCVTQIHVYKRYSESNLDNLAVAQTIPALHARYPHAELMLETVGDDSQVALRMGDAAMESIAGFRQYMKNFPVPLSEGEQAHHASIAKIKDQAFAYFDRTGLTPEALETLMLSEAQRAMAGPHIIYFFSVLDAWRPASDHRRHNVEGMIKKIPQLIADYKSFLSDRKRRLHYGDILYVTRTERPARSHGPWKETLESTMTVGSINPITIYVYRQR